MSSKSNDQGRAFEAACLLALSETLTEHRGADRVCLDKNSSYDAAMRAWNKTEEIYHSKIMSAAHAMVKKLIELEPLAS